MNSVIENLSGYKPRLNIELYRNWQRRFIRHLKWMKLKVRGIEKISEQGPALLAPNHMNWKDIPLLGAIIKRPIRFAADVRLFDEKLLYDFLSHKFRSLTKYPSINKAIDRMCYTFAKFLVHRVSRSGSFPAKIVTNDFSLIEAAKHLLLKGDLVCIFPEGTLGKPGKLHRFKLGAAKILFDYYLEFKQSIPAYPIGINGTEKIYRPGMSLGLQVGSPLFIEDFVETNERQTLLNFAVELRNRVLGCVQSFQLKDK